LRERQT